MKEKNPGQQPGQPETTQPIQGRAEGKQSLQGPTTVDDQELGAPGYREGKKVYTLKIPSEEQLARVNPEVLKFAGFFLLREWGNELTPDGFVMSAKLALKDLESGIDTKTGKAIESELRGLTGQPPVIYQLLDRGIPEIGDLFFPSEFAQAIRTFWNKVDTHRRQELRTIYSSSSNLTMKMP
jgi:hypothetical protein